ncbi:transposase [Thermococcus sp. P6]|uniref:RNA-guided endonuclease InsQ/TnpB family protein n=1 Tax=Thermococcus sp. P6 TaxID=122420 RepID=UPI000B59F9D7|nr:RNA-guided endonuclease TnpB family protein [Thermococcus sp. P6]ASJ10333.1 transposase [Thermococcus sp. P6]
MLSYRYRLYPSKTIQTRLNEQLGLCRWLYNRLLYELNKARKQGRKITQKDTQSRIVELKKEEKPELKKVYSKVLQMVNYQLWSNIKALSRLKKNGKKIGKLRYKTGNSFKTLNFNQSGFKIENNKLILSKVRAIPIKVHRKIEGKIKGVIIKREKSGKWYAIFQVEDEPKPLPKTGKAIGIDVGLRYFSTDSDGRQIENPRFYEKTLKRIRKLQKDLSRKKKGSKNWEKCRIKLAKTYEKLVNQRDDFLHKLSRFYVNNYDVIVVENLKIRNMVKNHRLSSKILDASWGKFLQMLSYKAERAGRILLKVNPRDTSEGLTFDDPCRDFISANRILARGLGRPFQPVEGRPLLLVTALAVIEGQVSSMKQEAPCVSEG